MTTILFAGPSIFGLPAAATEGLEIRPPALRGDLMRAVGDGARSIGLIDGVFETVPSVWHKEILQALSQGVAVYGASSMGALRAAECHAFGMIGVGRVFEDYVSGQRTADADVAVAHAPAALGHRPLTLALVDAQAALNRLHKTGGISFAQLELLSRAAGDIHFKQRDWARVMERAAFDPDQGARLQSLLERQDFSQKREDALQLLNRLRHGSDASPPQPGFTLSRTHYLEGLLQA